MDPSIYTEAIAELGLEDWSELKEKLYSKDGDEVLLCLQSYLAARRVEIDVKYCGTNTAKSLRWVQAHLEMIRARKKLYALL
jgi:hypothetical protein